MKIIFILLSISVIIFIISRIQEPFTDLDSTFLGNYQKFMTFYNQFMINYTKAITTSWGLAKPAPTSSTQSNSNPSMAELNAFIPTLSAKVGPLPLITDPLPSVQTTDDLAKIQATLPQDAAPFKNALEWMNKNLSEAHSKLASSLSAIQGFTDVKGIATHDYKTMEYFDDICQQIQTCQQTQQQSMQQKVQPTFDSFFPLQPLLDRNNQLVAETQQIQDKAQSGALLPKGIPRVSPYKLPAGSDKLMRMKQENPEQYKEYQQNYGQFVAMKQYSDQINGNLR